MALGPALAHLFELPNKLGMRRDDYFVVQQAYRGWASFGWLLLVQLASILALAAAMRHQPPAFWPVVAAAAFLVAAQAIFWSFTYPANVATANWTRAPEDWMRLRARWEYSHAAGAAMQLLVMVSPIIGVLRRTAG